MTPSNPPVLLPVPPDLHAELQLIGATILDRMDDPQVAAAAAMLEDAIVKYSSRLCELVGAGSRHHDPAAQLMVSALVVTRSAEEASRIHEVIGKPADVAQGERDDSDD